MLSRCQIATEKLHETYLSLRAAESKCLNSNVADASPEPYAADAFLAALREVNSTFEGITLYCFNRYVNYRQTNYKPTYTLLINQYFGKLHHNP